MSRFVDVGQHATGVIAIGQTATGFVAIGQNALGVIAIGQVARGCIAVGQLSFGLFSVGMLAGGVVQATGMIGLAGRRGVGLIPHLVPTVQASAADADLTRVESVASSGVAGWVAMTLRCDQNGEAVLQERGEPPVLKLHPSLLGRARSAAALGPVKVLAHVELRGPVLVCDRLTTLSEPAQLLPVHFVFGALRFAALAVMATAFWYLVAFPLLAALSQL